jgi:hypothetical protein
LCEAAAPPAASLMSPVLLFITHNQMLMDSIHNPYQNSWTFM